MGAISITGALILLVYAIVTANDAGWNSFQTVSMLFTSVDCVRCIYHNTKTKQRTSYALTHIQDIQPISKQHSDGSPWGAWIPMWFFLNLYLQQIQGYGAFESGLALLPMTAAIMALMIGASSRFMIRLGVKHSLVAGLGLLAVALLLFVATPSGKGSSFTHVLPASLVGAGGMSLAYIPALMSAVSHARKEDSGLASGIVNTSYQIGSALGLAIMVAIASAQTFLDENSGIGSIETLKMASILHS